MKFITVILILVIRPTAVNGQNGTSSACSTAQHCKNDTCHDNKCTFGCKDGYYGRMCSSRCNFNCNNNTCSESGPEQGFCTQGCSKAFWGDTCSKTCSIACGKCSRQDGSMCEDCDGYHYGESCQMNCYQTCPDYGCNDHGNCRTNSASPRCGYNCIDCDKESGSCKLCKAGYAGKNCSVYCKNCKGMCTKEGCTEECESGYHGYICLQPCSLNCDGDCFQANGSCKSCKLGYYGGHCETRCAENCAENTCNRTSGNCINGCKTGVYGQACEYSCTNCLSDRCDQHNGRCSVDCLKGFYGDACRKKCDKNCDHNQCDRVIGFCIKSNKTAPGSTIYTVSTGLTVTKTPETPIFAIAGSVGVLLLCLTIAGILLFKFCKSSCLRKGVQYIHPTEKTLTRPLPDTPDKTSAGEYHVINEDELDPSNQSYIIRSIPSTNPSENEHERQVRPLSERIRVGSENEALADDRSQHSMNVSNMPEANPLEASSRNLMSDYELIAKVENTIYRKGFMARQTALPKSVQLCIPKQYLGDVSEGETQF